MVSKNNHLKKMEQSAQRQNHFSIRKLSVGAASVLVGASLFLGTHSTTAHAAEVKADANTDQTENNTDQTKAQDINKVTVEKSTQTLEVTSSAAVPSSAADTASSTATVEMNSAVSASSSAVVQASSTAVLQTSSAASSASSSATSSATSVATQEIAPSSSAASQATTTTFNVADLAGTSSNKSFNLANVLGESKFSWGGLLDNISSGLSGLFNPGTSDNNNTDTSQAPSVDDSGYTVATSWGQVLNAASSNAKGVKISGNISAFSNLNLYNDFAIVGADANSSLTMGSNRLNNNSTLTLKDLTINGSVMGNGTLDIEGTVNSNVNYFNSANLSDAEISDQVGSKHPGASTDNWRSANITASTVNIKQGATLNVNRDITGDGIVLKNGQATFIDDGSTYGITKQVGNGGTLNVGVNGNLTINLKDAQYASRANEQGRSIDNANTGIRAENNGHVNTGDSAQITINAGHGRAINFNEPFGGNNSVQLKTNQLTSWYRNRNVRETKSYAQDTNNTIILGDSTKMNITGRDGIVMGNRSLFQTGDHSIVHIDGKGNGAGLLGDAFSVVEVSPQSQLLMTSDGKDSSGMYAGGNFIGLGENGKFRVEHDATFRYKMINRGGSSNFYDDNMNIISINTNSQPEVYVGPNATFDGQSDYTNYYGEIFSFPLGSTDTVFQIDGAKYVNWEKNSNITGGPNQGNLYYSMGKGLIDATTNKGRTYYVFRWPTGNLADGNITFNSESPEAIKQSLDAFKTDSYEWWKDVNTLATKYSKSGNTTEWEGHQVTGIEVTGADIRGQKRGDLLNKWEGNTNNLGFAPNNSQRLVLVSTIIPTQEDQTEQKVTPFKIQIRENKNLQPGQVVLVQKGVNGLERTTTTTYYNVDPSTGQKTLDTSQGVNGVSTKTTVLDKEQDEIIEIAPQTATVDYLYNNGSQTTPIVVNGSDLQAQITAVPVQTDAQGNVEFTSTGQALANTIQYNDSNDVSRAIIQVSQDASVPTSKVKVDSNTWEDAVKSGTNKYDVTGLTRDAIVSAAEAAGLNNPTVVGPTTGPNYQVVLSVEAQDANIKVEYIDQTENNRIMSSKDVTGKIGDKISYDAQPTIADYEAQGYKLVANDYDQDGKDFTDANNGKTYKIVFVHEVQPVTPTTPPTDVPDNTPKQAQPDQLTRNIDLNVNYVNSDGTQFTGDIPANAHQEVTFEGTAYIDKTNGQMVNAIKQGNDWIVNTADKSTPEISWTIKAGEKNSFDAVTSPQETGYHATSVTPSQYADGVNVKAITGLTQDTTSPINVTVTYSPNGEEVKNPETVVPTQTVKFVDSEGNELQRANIQTGSPFIYSGDTYDKVTGQEIRKGSWNRESYTFKTVNAPVIEGYVARQKSAGGLTATPTNPDVEAEIVYEKVGKIIPVTPDGKEIPGAPQPKYPNDPNDPTAVVPNEPTPVIPGYTTPTKTVTPEDPTKDTPVVYTQDSVDGSVTYIDDTTGKTLSTVELKGTIGEKITYTTTATIKDYEDKGYVFVSSDFDNGNEVFEKTGNKFEVHLKHGTVPVNPQNPGKPGKPINPNDPEGPKYPRGTAKANLYKTIRRTINFVTDGGKSLGSQVQSVNFSASGVLDKVTGEWVEPLTWDQDQKTISQYTLPNFGGYKVKTISSDGINNSAIGAVVVTPKSGSQTVTVTYQSTNPTQNNQGTGLNLAASFLAIPNTFSSMANNLKQNVRSLFNTQLFWSQSKTQNLFKL